MIYCFTCLRHHVIVSSDNDDSNICYLSTTSTHGGKRLMTWSIKECDSFIFIKLNIVSTDMLGDTTGLTGDHVCTTDIIKKRSFTMVNVTHYSYNWRTWFKIFLIIFLFYNTFRNISRYKFNSKPKLFSNDRKCFGIQTLVD